MTRTEARRRRVRLAATVLTLLLTTLATARASSAADVASEAAVKAAFLYNFVKFTDWPGTPGHTPIVLCVVGGEGIAEALTDTVRGQAVNGRPLDVQRPQDSSSWKSCHLLFVADSEAARSATALGAVKTLPVLTVSDSKDFAQSNGIIELYLESARMRFAINVGTSERAGLHISSRLLALARIVGGGHVP